MQIRRAFLCMIVLGKKTAFILVYRGGLLVCQRLDEFRLIGIRYSYKVMTVCYVPD